MSNLQLHQPRISVLFSLPFFLCGGLKIIHDLALWREFRAVKPPEEH